MMQAIILRRAVTGTRIPYGDPFPLAEGAEVEIVQTLGGNYTVQTTDGRLLRIDAKDADALGLAPVENAFTEAAKAEGPLDRDRVLEVLRTVFDPEIPINVVDLGLIYECELTPAQDGRSNVEIKMSMTAPGCGMGDVLREDVNNKLHALPGIDQVNVEIVWDPPWDSSRMSESAKLELGWL